MTQKVRYNPPYSLLVCLKSRRYGVWPVTERPQWLSHLLAVSDSRPNTLEPGVETARLY